MKLPSRTKILLIFPIFCLAAALGACRGGGSDATDSPTPSPSPSPRIITPGPTTEPPVSEYRLVYREAGALEDVIWSVAPHDPASKSQLAVIPHREGFSVRASVSPDGSYLAYLSLPELALSADSSQADVYLIDLTALAGEPGAQPVKVAETMDYNFIPLWSPDGGLLYMRAYAGPEFLNARQTIFRVRVFPPRDPAVRTPIPTPTPEPGIEPWPGPDTTVMSATVANVLRWTPLGFSADEKSMLFLEERGGTSGQTVVGIYSPARTTEVDALYDKAEDAWYAAQQINKQAADEAAANGQPPPELVTPVPTPAPDARLVVPLSEQSVTDASLSPDRNKVAYLDQTISDEGDFVISTHIADMIEATTSVLPLTVLSPGTQLAPCWYPDGRITMSVLPSSGGPGQMVIVALGQSSITMMRQPESGYDIPWGWAPDGSWLPVLHWSGTSLVEPGDGRLDMVSAGGHRMTLLEGSANAGRDSVVGWLKLPAEEAAG